jgi:CheY-like chemotaxis protein
MPEIWREELQHVAEAYGLRTEALEDWFALLEPDSRETTPVAIRLSNYLDELAGVLAQAADGSDVAQGISLRTVADLVSLAQLFDAPGLQAWAENVGGKNGHLRLSREAAELFSAIATALRDSNDTSSLRERDGEWATLPLAAIPEAKAAPEAKAEPEPPPVEVSEPPPAEVDEPASTEPPTLAYEFPESTTAAVEAADVPVPPEITAHRVLVMAAPSIGREFLIRQLIEAQLSVDAADNPFEAETALARRRYDIVIVDPGSGEAGDVTRLTGLPDLAERIVFLVDGSDLSLHRALESIGPVINKPPSSEEIEALLNRYL